MTEPAVTAAPEDTVEHAARLMYAHRVKRLPVTDGSGRLVGIISRADVLSVFDRPDGEIRREITENVIVNELRIDPEPFTVTVENGIVTLEGSPGDGRARPCHRRPCPARGGRGGRPRPSAVPAVLAFVAGPVPWSRRGPRLITGSAGGLPLRAGGPGQSTVELARTSKGPGPGGG